jgi:Xaa-Pro aminopeptidase
MVTTVEPGIYIRKSDKIDPEYWDIGIRIEDDVLVTDRHRHYLIWKKRHDYRVWRLVRLLLLRQKHKQWKY